MAWKTYHTKIRITAGGVDFTLPVDSLSVQTIPYSGSGEVATTLWDGRRIQRIDGWHYRAEISWRELKPTDHIILMNAITEMAANPTCLVDFDPIDNPSTKTITMIIEDAADALTAAFSGMVRARGASLTLVSANHYAVPKTWITE